MTPPTLPALTRLSPALLALALTACSDDGGDGSASASNTDGTTNPTTVTNPTSTGPSSESNTEPTTTGNGSMSNSGTETGTTAPGDTSTTTTPGDTTTTTTTPGETTQSESTTTNPIDTESASSTGSTTVPDDTTTTTTETTVAPDTSSSESTEETTEQPPEPCGCADIEIPLDDGIFVLSDNAQLWKYKPGDNSFQMLGAFNCGGMTDTFSMAVDRLGFAWVMFNTTGDIWKVDVTNPTTCVDPGYVPGMQGTKLYGMGFVSNSKFDACDNLYGNTFNGGAFSEGPNQGTFLKLDPNTLMLNLLGPTPFNGAEVTGNSDGRVFLFGGVNPSKIREVNKATGATISTFNVTGVETSNGFAFAFFAGDFYIFTESGPFSTVSKVTHVDYDDSDNNGIQDIKTIPPNAPIRIVGAGVSTCAPVSPQ